MSWPAFAYHRRQAPAHADTRPFFRPPSFLFPPCRAQRLTTYSLPLTRQSQHLRHRRRSCQRRRRKRRPRSASGTTRKSLLRPARPLLSIHPSAKSQRPSLIHRCTPRQRKPDPPSRRNHSGPRSRKRAKATVKTKSVSKTPEAQGQVCR